MRKTTFGPLERFREPILWPRHAVGVAAVALAEAAAASGARQPMAQDTEMLKMTREWSPMTVAARQPVAKDAEMLKMSGIKPSARGQPDGGARQPAAQGSQRREAAVGARLTVARLTM